MRIVIATNQVWNEFLADAISAKTQFQTLLVTKKQDLSLSRLEAFQPDYIFFPHWSFIIKPEIFKRFRCVIFHMTDLPFGRGGSPLQNLISRGLKETKISAIACTEVLDGGDIYLKRDLDLAGSAREIFARASKTILEMILEIVKNQIQPTPQTGEITVFERRTPDQSDLSGLMDIQKIYDHIRMLDADGYPHAFLENEHIKFEFTDAGLKDGEVLAKVRIRRKTDV